MKREYIDFSRGNHRAYWDADYDIQIRRRRRLAGALTIVRDAVLILAFTGALVAATIVNFQ